MAPTPEATESAFLKAHDRKAKRTDWGFFSYGDGPPAAGGGEGSFVWFANRDQMLQFIAKHLVYLAPGPANRDPEEVEATVGEIVEKLRAKKGLTDTDRKKLNDALKKFSQITWWGTFEDLATGRSAYAKEVRAWIRSEEDGSKGSTSRPVSPKEMAEFREAILEYGI